VGLKGAAFSANPDDVAGRRFASSEMMKIAERFSDHKHAKGVWFERRAAPFVHDERAFALSDDSESRELRTRGLSGSQ